MKEALKQYATWYKDGVLNQDFVTSDMDKMFQGCINGDVGIQPMEQWFGYTPGADIIANQGEKAVFDAYKIPSANGEKVIYPIEPANYGYIVVSKTCKNPEAALKLLNFYAYQANDAKGKEDPDFIASLNDHAYANIPYALRVIDPNTDYNIYETVQESLKKYEAGEEVDRAELGGAIVKYEDCVKWIETKEPASVGNWNQQGSPKSAYGLSKEILDNNEYFIDARHGKQIKALLNAGSTLDDILIEGFTKIIVGEKPVDYFDTLVNDWKKAGGEEATKEVNEVCK